MKYKDLAERFTLQFPEYTPLLNDHIAYNGSVLNHVFFGEWNDYLIKLIEEEKEIDKIRGLFEFLEFMAVEGDEQVKELLSVTILERLGDSKDVLRTAYTYMGSYTKTASDEVENFWGRS